MEECNKARSQAGASTKNNTNQIQWTMRRNHQHKPMRAITILLLAGAAFTAAANNIATANLVLTGNIPGVSAQVRFDMGWENSWRTSSAPNNWDAAWVFVKYRHSSTGEWAHAQLGSDAQHVAAMGSTIATGLRDPGTAYDPGANWGVGTFVYRSANGAGTFTANGTELRWNYGQQGLAYSDIAEVRVFAIEMVYVPQEAFWLGSGGSEYYHFKDGTTNNPFAVTSEGAITMGNVNGQLWANGDTYIETATLPAAFPKGFSGFYAMKHSISQQGYVDFLNTLNRAQQSGQVGTAISGTSITDRYVMSRTSTVQYRNGIRCDATIPAAPTPVSFYCDGNNNGIGGETTDGQWLACNWLNWNDVRAYLDWSGLRPMTELEYEKACRGPLTPVANAYAWGGTSVTGAANITSPGAVDEASNTIGANAIYNNNANVQGPMRVGVFAAGSTSRTQAGAGYYGMLELSGNLYERTITVDNATYRAYLGTHGDGILVSWGGSNVASWPSTAGYRGGDWGVEAAKMCVSDRRSPPAPPIGGRSSTYGGRGLRAVP